MTPSEAENRKAFDAWLDQFFRDYFARRPVNATFIGAHHYDHDLPDFSPEGDADLIAGATWLRSELQAIPDIDLTESQLHDRRLADGFLELELWEVDSSHFQRGNPALYTGEAVFSVISLFQRDAEPLADRVDAAISRMCNLPAFLENARRRVSSAPLAWTQRAAREADSAVTYFGQGIRILADERGIDNSEFRECADIAAAACADHANWLKSELAANPNENWACGAAAFDLYLRKGHCLREDQDTSWVLAYAERALSSARTDMEEMAREIDPAAGWRDLLAKLQDFHPSVDDYYDAFPRVGEECRRQAIEDDLVTWPDFPITFGPIPRSDREAATGLYYLYYRCPPPFGYHETQHYLVPPIEPDMPR